MKSISRESFANKDTAIVINDVEYKIPARTQLIQDKLIKLNKDKNISEYNRCNEIVETILSAKEAKAIFKNGTKENLDYMNDVAVTIIDLYNLEKVEQNRARIDEVIKQYEDIRPIVEVIGNIENVVK